MRLSNKLSYIILLPIILLIVLCSSCQSSKDTANIPTPTLMSYNQVSPNFNADSAYLFIKRQVDFGPRTPNSAAHIDCGDYLVKKLKEFGAEVIEQKATLKTYDNITLNARNIIGIYNPEHEKRILLFAHWDTRPFADQDQDKTKQTQPILGANDGASGVGVLLEIARKLNNIPVDIGIDIIFFDADDWGQPSYERNQVPGNWFCLGSQYWVKNPHRPNYRANFGVLLDMVGAQNATFYKEGYSVEYALNITEKVWASASRLGYGSFFINKKSGYITDDHVPVNQFRRAPSINIIHTSDDTSHGFGEYWHTHNDNMNVIDKATLKAVGQTVMEVLYTE